MGQVFKSKESDLVFVLLSDLIILISIETGSQFKL